MKKSKKILVANWKMNPNTLEEARKIALEMKAVVKGKKNIELVVCPPSIFLSDVSNILGGLKNIFIGAQDVFVGNTKSITGEVSVEMILSSKARYSIIGHSSRRNLGETDEIIAEKVLSVIKSGIKAIICVGEKERDENGLFYSSIKEQLEKGLSKIKKNDLKKILIAYEPVWAIGKKDTEAMKAEDLHEMTIFIKKVLSDKFGQTNISSVPILYGGSVSKRNVQDLALKGEVSGLLVGRESLNTQNFSEIIAIVESI